MYSKIRFLIISSCQKIFSVCLALQDIHKVKLKNAWNEKRKKLRRFSFSINIANFEAFRRTKKLISNLFFLKSVGIKVSGLCNISTLDRIGFVGSNQDCGLKSSCFLGCIGGFNFGEQTSIWKSLKFGFSTFGPVFDPYLGLAEQEQIWSNSKFICIWYQSNT